MNKFIYAQLDEGGKVIAITYPRDELEGDNIIDLSQYDNPDKLLGAMYDGKSFILSQPTEPKQPQEQPTAEELIYAETTYQTALLEVMSLG